MRIKLTWFAYVSVLISSVCVSQVTNVTALITDSDLQAWNNGTYSISFLPVPGNPGPYVYNGSPMTAAQKGPYTGTLNGSGVLSVSLPDNAFIAPAGTKWQFNICPLASSACGTVATVVTGASQSLTSVLSAGVPVVRLPASCGTSYGYADGEINVTPLPGGCYYNVTQQCSRTWTGSAWECFTVSPQAGSTASSNLLTFQSINSGSIVTGTLQMDNFGNFFLTGPNALSPLRAGSFGIATGGGSFFCDHGPLFTPTSNVCAQMDTSTNHLANSYSEVLQFVSDNAVPADIFTNMRATPNNVVEFSSSTTPGTGFAGIQLLPTLFANVGVCSGATEGTHFSITNGSTGTPGATVAGGGSFHVSIYCNGTNWIVG